MAPSMPSSPVHHPVFALWSLMSQHEPAEIRRHRDELLAGLLGRVIEVGAGAGSNFAHYPATVEEVVAVERVSRTLKEDYVGRTP